LGGWPGWVEGMEHLAGDKAVSDSGPSRFRFSFSEAPRHVVAGGLVTTQAHDHDDVQGSVGVAVEPVERLRDCIEVGVEQGRRIRPT